MTVSPADVFAFRSAAFVKNDWLCQEGKRLFRSLPAGDLTLRSRNFIERTAQVHRPGPAAFIGFPWDRRCQSIVHLENTRSVPKLLETIPIGCGQAVTCHSQQLSRSYIKQDGTGLWER